MGRCKSPGSVKSFLWYATQLPGASIPGLGRSPGEGKGYPLQYSGLEKSMNCMVHVIAKSRTRLRNFPLHFTSLGLVSCVFTSWVSSGLTIGSDCSLIDAGWQVFLSFLTFFQGSLAHIGGLLQILSSWTIFGRHFMIKFCPILLWVSSQIRWKFLIYQLKC